MKNNCIELRLSDLAYSMLKDMADSDMRTFTSMIEYCIMKEHIRRFMDEEDNKKSESAFCAGDGER